MIDLRASPFFLSEESITWVQGALSSMTPEEKIGQLFCITAGGENPRPWESWSNGISLEGLCSARLRPLKY